MPLPRCPYQARSGPPLQPEQLIAPPGYRSSAVEGSSVTYPLNVSNLKVVSRIDQDPATYVRGCSTVLREFNHLTQDSGNVSWLVESAGQQFFVKTAGTIGASLPGAPVPYFDHARRVRLLRNAVDVAKSCQHSALPALLNVIESPVGPALVYEAASGDLVGVPAKRRCDPASSYHRFAHLQASVLLDLFDTLIDAHVALAGAGWVAGDLYDGCLIVDFSAPALSLIDLDSYRRGPTTNDMGRMFGSTRFMAPEEFDLGARIDERTTVFTLGRIVWHFATRLTEDPANFCGTDDLARVVLTAIQPSPADRHTGIAALAHAWRGARNTQPS